VHKRLLPLIPLAALGAGIIAMPSASAQGPIYPLPVDAATAVKLTSSDFIRRAKSPGRVHFILTSGRIAGYAAVPRSGVVTISFKKKIGRKTITLASAKKTFKASGAALVSARLTVKGRAAFRAARKTRKSLSATITVAYKPNTGKSATSTRKIVFTKP
jgi:hypothetical protein